MKHLVHTALVLSGLGAAPALAGDFTVVDGMAHQEIAENSRLYVDGHLAATFVLNADTPELRRHVGIDDTRLQHEYALCGEITIRRPDGRSEIHAINSGGVLHGPSGHTLIALGTANFTDFFLADPADPTVVERHPGRSDICAPPAA
ncbi:hypothetical protein AA103196_2004 [Ameyamaea chiangmaiensis NBRC 103196]|uniref:Uncharacterized protein n=1 Tax=Ameyamaea chiangmaiensis TaxID=442969 RepID=A0A850P567_9PROT|nr:hypothetical protein [Ameyamaea chiangmaiensis]MBS4073731.1 hypothetical protein [Ameyamaea chiangmaiensis]NVN39777.1 hypothetical protein [Ameyamaea chiangmaiensis]GBQ68655.1 hypothetical protein AA103196_2004 [Ameyamaea chiangmaiensis NBRC 103196]